MTSEFNKNILFENISFLLKERGMKIGELENEAGVSPGYISRASKEGNTKPGIDFIMKAAEALNVSIDSLVKLDLSRLTPTEKYLIPFLEKLINDTQNDKLFWQRELPEYLNGNMPHDSKGNTQHPLFKYKSFYEENEEGYDALTARVVFTSHQFGVHTTVDGNCYNLRMKNGVMLYVMKIHNDYSGWDDPDGHAIEIWVCPGTGANQFLCGNKATSKLSVLIDQLYSLITECMNHPKVREGVKFAIDAFMEDDLEDDDYPY